MTAYLYVLQTLFDWDVGYITAEQHQGGTVLFRPDGIAEIGGSGGDVFV